MNKKYKIKKIKIFGADFGNVGLKEHQKWALPAILGISFLVSNLMVVFTENWSEIDFFSLSIVTYLQSSLLLSVAVFLLTYSLFGFIVDDLWKISATMAVAIPRIIYLYIVSLSIILLISHAEIAAMKEISLLSSFFSNGIVPCVILLQFSSDRYITSLLGKSQHMYKKTYVAYKTGVDDSYRLFIMSATLSAAFFIAAYLIPEMISYLSAETTAFESTVQNETNKKTSETKSDDNFKNTLTSTLNLVSLTIALLISALEFKILKKISKESSKDKGVNDL